jgi:peroxiredoxin
LADIKALDANVIAISADTPEQNRQLREDMNFDFFVLSDSEGQAISAFGLQHKSAGIHGEDIARPGVFVLDRGGRIAWRSLTENWRIRVRPETIIEQLKQLP